MEKSIKKRWVMGLEPTVSRTTIWRVSQLRHTHHANINPIKSENMPEGTRTPDTRLRRPVLYPAELRTHNSGRRSSRLQLSEKRQLLKRVMGIEPTYLAWKASVLPLNYTRKLMKDYEFDI